MSRRRPFAISATGGGIVAAGNVLTNLPSLQEVQILIGGQEVDTLAGHVDLRRPLRKNEGLLLPPTSTPSSPPSP